jgi:hypothetical protein
LKITEAGYVYELSHTLEGSEVLIFANQTPSQKHDGTTSSEVLRALIDHTQVTQGQAGTKIVQNLRLALTIFEAQALIQKVENGQLQRPEDVAVGKDGHFELRINGQMP